MLQINSGKLYQTGVGRTNRLRGVLYTNLVVAGVDDAPIETEAGTLLAGEFPGSPLSLVYELTERLEGSQTAPGALVSHTVRPYLSDFAYVVAFVLNVTCTPDHDLTARLLSGHRAAAVFTDPAKLIKRVFDREVWCQPQDRERLQEFVRNLLGLRRKSFLVAMKAIRTYITGLHRIADDLELAYTLLVASIESLAHGFGGHPGTWEDLELGKREKLELALESADPTTLERVKSAIIEIEHLAIARRFREFALEYVPPDYFRGTGRVGALGRCDMEDGLREAYGLRSRYVHRLQRLPDMLSIDRSYSESMNVGHRMYLTLQGLANVAREIILEYVRREPKVEKETYDYRLERFGIVQAELAPEYWIGRSDSFDARTGRRRFEAFLQQFSGYLRAQKPITNLSAIMPRIEELLPNSTRIQRQSLIALYAVYNRIVPAEERAPRAEVIIREYESVLREAAPEALVTHLLLDVIPVWNVEEHRTLYREYFRQRNRQNGFRAPGLFEAGVGLALAERLRAQGDVDASRAVLAFALDNAPVDPTLEKFVNAYDPNAKIDWSEVLLPKRTPQ